ncbi:MAG: hypothetical protein FWE37_02645 [Spirochaetaceae bacterium]|nr:hypothetical protein [Spirochaetaceae bacterium]
MALNNRITTYKQDVANILVQSGYTSAINGTRLQMLAEVRNTHDYKELGTRSLTIGQRASRRAENSGTKFISSKTTIFERKFQEVTIGIKINERDYTIANENGSWQRQLTNERVAATKALLEDMDNHYLWGQTETVGGVTEINPMALFQVTNKYVYHGSSVDISSFGGKDLYDMVVSLERKLSRERGNTLAIGTGLLDKIIGASVGESTNIPLREALIQRLNNGEVMTHEGFDIDENSSKILIFNRFSQNARMIVGTLTEIASSNMVHLEDGRSTFVELWRTIVGNWEFDTNDVYMAEATVTY